MTARIDGFVSSAIASLPLRKSLAHVPALGRPSGRLGLRGPRSAQATHAHRPRLESFVSSRRDAIVGCYDYSALALRICRLAQRPEVSVTRLGASDGWPLDVLQLRTRGAGRRPLRVLVSAGVHGIEPSGPGAALLAMERLLADQDRFTNLELTVLPLVNPVGYRARRRGNADNLDLNRWFFDVADVPVEVMLTRPVLGGCRFDLGIDLHASRSVGERGFFALHRSAAVVLGPAMHRLRERYPILSESTNRYTLEAPGVLRSENTGTVKDYLALSGTRWAMTIEAPAVWPYERQVLGSADLVLELVEEARRLVVSEERSAPRVRRA
jgi:hypothetical protein